MNSVEYVCLDTLSKQLRLPRQFLLQELAAGKLPHLRVGRRLRFCTRDVAEVLRRQASAGVNADD